MDAAASFGTFFELGFDHIFGARDHIVFLLGLLLVCTGWRQLVAILVTFTVAHSATLLLAGGDWVRFPEAWIDPLIAGTIAVVGFENLWCRRQPRHRLAEIFVFGLLHGFGFASALRAAVPGLAGTAFLKPLVGFNLGVEVGQVLAALVVFPALAWLREHRRIGPWVVPVGSGLVAACGLFWLLRSTF